MREVAAHEHTALRSGHKVGKSTLDAALALWWWCVTPRARVILTAPTGHQVANVLWPEVRRLYLNARVPLGGRLYGTPDKGLKLEDGREIIGLNTNTPEAFAGISSPGLLFIVDEASGFPEPIFNAVFGNMAGGGRVLLTGNPTRTSGTFYDAFHARRGGWRPLHVSSLDTPNFHGGDVPGLANPAWAEWAAEQWGRGTPAWACRVEGNFPSTSDDTVIGLGVVEAARARWGEAPGAGRLTAGLDVARFDADHVDPHQGPLTRPVAVVEQILLRLARELAPVEPLPALEGREPAAAAWGQRGRVVAEARHVQPRDERAVLSFAAKLVGLPSLHGRLDVAERDDVHVRLAREVAADTHLVERRVLPPLQALLVHP
jgi:hypothetical protein